ncbi:hypothetical protein [Prochlorococcus sp. MIT 1300]|uniref:hypothetical protein n=1 Tax=Prochlorococcus sp. MIT 1300 TaxID=3096218 RepID=UPI002A74E756|nr:hypothetical protein [Prochlorococcus sp. MIT 1300]
MSRSPYSLLPTLTIGTGLLVLGIVQLTSNNRFQQRIKNLEELMGQQIIQSPKLDAKTPIGPIKSITFRIGTKDDRLRIYWADGSKSDLPCSKEHATKEQWACG